MFPLGIESSPVDERHLLRQDEFAREFGAGRGLAGNTTASVKSNPVRAAAPPV
jgi:hypothetical protein